MKTRCVFCAVPLFALMFAPTAHGAVEAYSFINISGFGLFVDADANGVADGGPVTQGVHVAVIAATFSSAALGNVGSIAGGPVTTSNFNTTPAGQDTLQAFEGAGAAPSENTFINAVEALPFARGDTDGSGAVIAGLGFPFGASVSTVAEVQLRTDPGVSDFGRADSATTSNASFTIIPLAPLTIVAIFDATGSLLADLTSFPPGVEASADTSFNITVDAVGGSVFAWAPDGISGGIVGGVEYSDPFSLNTSVSTSPGTTSSVTNPLAEFRAGFTLTPGAAYTFTLTQGTSAIATAVPEMSSIVMCALLPIFVLSAARHFSLRRA